MIAEQTSALTQLLNVYSLLSKLEPEIFEPDLPTSFVLPPEIVGTKEE